MQILRGNLDRKLPESITIPARSRIILFSTNLPARGIANALLKGTSSGPFQMAVVAAEDPKTDADLFAAVIVNNSLVGASTSTRSTRSTAVRCSHVSAGLPLVMPTAHRLATTCARARCMCRSRQHQGIISELATTKSTGWPPGCVILHSTMWAPMAFAMTLI